jgi:hypothetical protein
MGEICPKWPAQNVSIFIAGKQCRDEHQHDKGAIYYDKYVGVSTQTAIVKEFHNGDPTV